MRVASVVASVNCDFVEDSDSDDGDGFVAFVFKVGDKVAGIADM